MGVILGPTRPGLHELAQIMIDLDKERMERFGDLNETPDPLEYGARSEHTS